MAEFELLVKGTPRLLIPRKLMVDANINLETQTAEITFILVDDGAFNSDVFEFNQLSVRGKLKHPLPLDYLKVKNHDGTINLPLVNGILAGLDATLSVDEEAYAAQTTIPATTTEPE